jgi:hypothetical protein
MTPEQRLECQRCGTWKYFFEKGLLRPGLLGVIFNASRNKTERKGTREQKIPKRHLT